MLSGSMLIPFYYIIIVYKSKPILLWLIYFHVYCFYKLIMMPLGSYYYEFRHKVLKLQTSIKSTIKCTYAINNFKNFFREFITNLIEPNNIYVLSFMGYSFI